MTKIIVYIVSNKVNRESTKNLDNQIERESKSDQELYDFVDKR